LFRPTAEPLSFPLRTLSCVLSMLEELYEYSKFIAVKVKQAQPLYASAFERKCPKKSLYPVPRNLLRKFILRTFINCGLS